MDIGCRLRCCDNTIEQRRIGYKPFPCRPLGPVSDGSEDAEKPHYYNRDQDAQGEKPEELTEFFRGTGKRLRAQSLRKKENEERRALNDETILYGMHGRLHDTLPEAR